VCVCICLEWHERMSCFYTVQYNTWKNTDFTYIRCAKKDYLGCSDVRHYELQDAREPESTSTIALYSNSLLHNMITKEQTLKDKVWHQKVGNEYELSNSQAGMHNS
jgi:hypothetical protein